VRLYELWFFPSVATFIPRFQAGRVHNTQELHMMRLFIAAAAFCLVAFAPSSSARGLLDSGSLTESCTMATIDLGLAAPFAVMAGSTITSMGAQEISLVIAMLLPIICMDNDFVRSTILRLSVSCVAVVYMWRLGLRFCLRFPCCQHQLGSPFHIQL